MILNVSNNFRECLLEIVPHGDGFALIDQRTGEGSFGVIGHFETAYEAETYAAHRGGTIDDRRRFPNATPDDIADKHDGGKGDGIDGEA